MQSTSIYKQMVAVAGSAGLFASGGHESDFAPAGFWSFLLMVVDCRYLDGRDSSEPE